MCGYLYTYLQDLNEFTLVYLQWKSNDIISELYPSEMFWQIDT